MKVNIILVALLIFTVSTVRGEYFSACIGPINTDTKALDCAMTYFSVANYYISESGYEYEVTEKETKWVIQQTDLAENGLSFSVTVDKSTAELKLVELNPLNKSLNKDATNVAPIS